MRTREALYEDYGLDPERVDKLLESGEREKNWILVCWSAVAVNPHLAEYISESIITDKGYDKIHKESFLQYYIPVKRDDFYGYRRKTLAVFDKLLRMGV